MSRGSEPGSKSYTSVVARLAFQRSAAFPTGGNPGRRSRDMPAIYAPLPTNARRNPTKSRGPLKRRFELLRGDGTEGIVGERFVTQAQDAKHRRKSGVRCPKARVSLPRVTFFGWGRRTAPAPDRPLATQFPPQSPARRESDQRDPCGSRAIGQGQQRVRW